MLQFTEQTDIEEQLINEEILRIKPKVIREMIMMRAATFRHLAV